MQLALDLSTPTAPSPAWSAMTAEERERAVVALARLIAKAALPTETVRKEKTRD